MLTWGPLEVLLVLSSSSGVWWSYRNTREAERDLAAVKSSGQNGLLLLTAKSVQAQQRAWGAVAGFLLFIILTLFPTQTDRLMRSRRVAFLGIVVASAFGSGRADRDRRQLWEHVIRLEHEALEQRRRSTDE